MPSGTNFLKFPKFVSESALLYVRGCDVAPLIHLSLGVEIMATKSERIADRIATLEAAMEQAKVEERKRARKAIVRAAERSGLVEAVAETSTPASALVTSLRDLSGKVLNAGNVPGAANSEGGDGHEGDLPARSGILGLRGGAE